jgi:hypothetical protein
VPPEFLTVEQVMDELDVSEWVVRKLIRTGDLPAQKLPSRPVQIERSMMERWIQARYADTRRWILENPGHRGVTATGVTGLSAASTVTGHDSPEDEGGAEARNGAGVELEVHGSEATGFCRVG